MAEACGNRPVIVTPTLFTDQLTQTEDGHNIKITTEQAVEIHEELIGQGYIKKGKLTQKYLMKRKPERSILVKWKIYARLSSSSWIRYSIPMRSNQLMGATRRRLIS